MGFQDALCKEYSSKSLEEKLADIFQLLKESYDALRAYAVNHAINIHFLESMAGVRFALMEIASHLHSRYVTEKLMIFTQSIQQKELLLMELTEEICTDKLINITDVTTEEDVVGPALYLIKLVVRQYGFICLKRLSEKYYWIIPKGLSGSQSEDGLSIQEAILCPFVIYEGFLNYSILRKEITEIILGKQQMKMLYQIVKVHKIMCILVL